MVTVNEMLTLARITQMMGQDMIPLTKVVRVKHYTKVSMMEVADINNRRVFPFDSESPYNERGPGVSVWHLLNLRHYAGRDAVMTRDRRNAENVSVDVDGAVYQIPIMTGMYPHKLKFKRGVYSNRVRVEGVNGTDFKNAITTLRLMRGGMTDIRFTGDDSGIHIEPTHAEGVFEGYISVCDKSVDCRLEQCDSVKSEYNLNYMYDICKFLTRDCEVSLTISDNAPLIMEWRYMDRCPRLRFRYYMAPCI